VKKAHGKLFFSTFLKDRGLRFTKERSVILQKTLSCNGHFDPESLYLQIRETGLKASRASVYRTLSLLCECGLIERVKKQNAALFMKICSAMNTMIICYAFNAEI